MSNINSLSHGLDWKVLEACQGRQILALSKNQASLLPSSSPALLPLLPPAFFVQGADNIAFAAAAATAACVLRRARSGSRHLPDMQSTRRQFCGQLQKDLAKKVLKLLFYNHAGLHLNKLQNCSF